VQRTISRILGRSDERRTTGGVAPWFRQPDFGAKISVSRTRSCCLPVFHRNITGCWTRLAKKFHFGSS